ncbi:MAG: hypothetical protein ACKOW9_03535 [Candidatus Paceibacterota bacterium]
MARVNNGIFDPDIFVDKPQRRGTLRLFRVIITVAALVLTVYSLSKFSASSQKPNDKIEKNGELKDSASMNTANLVVILLPKGLALGWDVEETHEEYEITLYNSGETSKYRTKESKIFIKQNNISDDCFVTLKMAKITKAQKSCHSLD